MDCYWRGKCVKTVGESVYVCMCVCNPLRFMLCTEIILTCPSVHICILTSTRVCVLCVYPVCLCVSVWVFIMTDSAELQLCYSVNNPNREARQSTTLPKPLTQYTHCCCCCCWWSIGFRWSRLVLELPAPTDFTDKCNKRISVKPILLNEFRKYWLCSHFDCNIMIFSMITKPHSNVTYAWRAS